MIHSHVYVAIFEGWGQSIEHELWAHCHWCWQTCQSGDFRFSGDGRLSVTPERCSKGVPRAVVAPAAVSAAAVLVVTVAVVRWASRERRFHEWRPAFGAQLSVFVYEHMNRQDAHHLSQHKGQRSKIKGPAVGVALLVVALARVTWVGWYVHNDANDVTETCRSI